jgi:DNA-binding MarR family transcriptional regulator
MHEPVDISMTRACYCLAARKAARAITRVYEKRLRPHGLRATQFSILAVLSIKGPTAVGELARILGLERTTLTRGAAIIERKGWLTQGESRDAREHVLQITDSGRARLETAFPDWQAAQTLVGERLAAGEWKVLHSAPGQA